MEIFRFSLRRISHGRVSGPTFVFALIFHIWTGGEEANFSCHNSPRPALYGLSSKSYNFSYLSPGRKAIGGLRRAK
jgi:hypothetical protein